MKLKLSPPTLGKMERRKQPNKMLTFLIAKQKKLEEQSIRTRRGLHNSSNTIAALEALRRYSCSRESAPCKNSFQNLKKEISLANVRLTWPFLIWKMCDSEIHFLESCFFFHVEPWEMHEQDFTVFLTKDATFRQLNLKAGWAAKNDRSWGHILFVPYKFYWNCFPNAAVPTEFHWVTLNPNAELESYFKAS